jgi:hypothetical protein
MEACAAIILEGSNAWPPPGGPAVGEARWVVVNFAKLPEALKGGSKL